MPEPRLRLAQVADLPTSDPTSWRRVWRRTQVRRLKDPLVRSSLALAGGSACGAVALFLLARGRFSLGVLALAVSVAQIAVYASVVMKALQDSKVIQYRREKRDLERRLNRERLHRGVLAASLDRIFEAESRSGSRSSPQLQTLLASLTTEVFQALVDNYFDVAVVITHEEGRYCHILRSAHSRGSRWHELEEGKRCEVKVSVEDKLASLAEFRYTVAAESATGWLRISVLTDDDLHPRDVELVEQMSGFIKLVAVRWETGAPKRLNGGAFLRRRHASSRA